MKMSKIAPGLLAATAALAGVFALAQTGTAAAPAGGCPTEAGFFLLDASLFPVTQTVDAAGNGDGYVCVKLLETAPTASAGVALIDDVVQ